MSDVNVERLEILKMVEEGKLDTKDAVELLNAIDASYDEEIKPKKDVKWLKVLVETENGKPKVNVKVPIAFVDVGLKLAQKFDPKIKDSGLDKINFKEIIEEVKNGAEGKIVDVEDEENHTKVKVYVE